MPEPEFTSFTMADLMNEATMHLFDNRFLQVGLFISEEVAGGLTLDQLSGNRQV